jgi:hypothetical protein
MSNFIETCPDCHKRPHLAKRSDEVGSHETYVIGCVNGNCDNRILVTASTKQDVIKKWNEIVRGL